MLIRLQEIFNSTKVKALIKARQVFPSGFQAGAGEVSALWKRWAAEGKLRSFYLFGIIGTLAMLHLGLVKNHLFLSNEVSYYMMCWGAAIVLLWQTRHLHNDGRDSASVITGLLLLGFVLVRMTKLWNTDLAFFRAAPILLALALGLLAFSWKTLRRRWILILVLCLTFFPQSAFTVVFEFGDLAAKFSHLTAVGAAFLLHYVGVKATYSGILLAIPTGQVSVGFGCTGGELIIWLLRITLLIWAIFPLNWFQKLRLAACGIGVGFLVGCVRVAWLVIIVNDSEKFHYWHSDRGGQIFLVGVSLVFAILCNWLIPPENSRLAEEQPKEIADGALSHKVEKRLWRLVPNILPSFLRGVRGNLRLLAGAWAGVLLASIYLLCIPHASRRLVSSAVFPDKANLDGWHLVSSSSLNPQAINKETANYERDWVEFIKQYVYDNDKQRLKIQMYYVINARGKHDALFENPKTPANEKYREDIRRARGIGYYSLSRDKSMAYLTACINPVGESTVNQQQFMQNHITQDFTPRRVLSWALGDTLLSDARCMWVRISTPATDTAYQVLETTWIDNYANWREMLRGEGRR